MLSAKNCKAKEGREGRRETGKEAWKGGRKGKGKGERDDMLYYFVEEFTVEIER